jgi:hypothetical protein
MIRRFAMAAITGALCAALIADVASAFTRKEAICVKSARTRSKLALLAARDAARTQLSTDLETCFGGGAGCVSQCQADLDVCSGGVDGKPGPTGDIRSCINDKCKVQNATDIDNCRDAADPVACVAQAQLALFLCNQGCAAASQAALIECNGVYNDCLQGCSNP